jgi:hypothetical protein
VITKDFHSMKDFRQIRGKSFVIMVDVTIPAGLSRHTRQVIAQRTTRAGHSPVPVTTDAPLSGSP